MKDWFKWNGVSCLDYGIRVTEQPDITIALERTEEVTVPGRSGSLHLTEGEDVFDDVTLKCTCYLPDSTRIPEIAAWLKGTGKLEFANRAGGFYYARLSENPAFERIMRGRTALSFDLEFVCKPFWYSEPVETQSFSSQGYMIHGSGTVRADPLITVFGTGDITLMVNGTTVHLEDLETNITLDCEAGIAYSTNDGVLSWAGEKVALEDGEWPYLKPTGQYNLFNWTLGDGARLDHITVQCNWRYL